jgi:hypothetical protein
VDSNHWPKRERSSNPRPDQENTRFRITLVRPKLLIANVGGAKVQPRDSALFMKVFNKLQPQYFPR